MPQSESISKLVAALAKAQEKFLKISKDRHGQEGNLKFLYSTLSEGLSAVRSFLNAEGIFLSQPTTMTENGLRVVTKVQLGDEWMSSDGLSLPNIEPGKNLGKTLTYGRRLDLFSFLSICGEDDDEDAPDLKPGTESTRTPVKGKPQVSSAPARVVTNATVANPGPGKPSVPIKIDTTQVRLNEIISKVEETRPGKVNPISVVGGNKVEDDLGITDDDLPDFDKPLKERDDFPADAPEDAVTFVALTPERNNEIQAYLKNLIDTKVMDQRKLSKFLELRHEGKRSFDVPSYKWEKTISDIQAAVQEGDKAIKVLLGVTKV